MHKTPASTSSPKILILLPFAPDVRGIHGGTRATGAMIDMLSQHHRVCALYLTGPGDPAPRQLPKCERLIAIPKQAPAMGRQSVIKRMAGMAARFNSAEPAWVRECWSPQMAAEIASVGAQFAPDIVHFEFHVMAQYIPAVRSVCPKATLIVTEHEPGITADSGRGNLTLRQRLGGLARRQAWRRYERRVLPLADGIIVFTRSDSSALKELLGHAAPPIEVIPLRLPNDVAPSAAGQTPVQSDFVFVGNFRHPPNADAARRLIGSIFPMIERSLPGATLAIVGTDPPQDLIEAASDQIKVTGWVDDPLIYLAGASVVLVPLRQGGGMRVKMLEACAAGTAIVASPMAVEGLSLRHGEEVMIAETDEQFAAAGVALMADPEARARLKRASRRWWEDKHDAGHWAGEYANFYASLGKCKAR